MGGSPRKLSKRDAMLHIAMVRLEKALMALARDS